MKNVLTGDPVREDTLFEAASMTKPVTAAAVLSLAEDGVLRLDDPLARWLPVFGFDDAVRPGFSEVRVVVTLTGPDIAENGAVVPVGASTTLAGAKRIALLVEKNPAMLAAIFDITEAVEPNISTRVKMGQSSNVIAVVITADNRVLFAQKEIKVTLGGCGG